MTFFASSSGINLAPLGKGFLLRSVFVKYGSNKTLSRVLDFLSPMAPMTMAEIGARLLSLGVPDLGMGIM